MANWQRWAARTFDGLSACGVAALTWVVFATVDDYGITWDETWHLTYGDHIVRFFETGGADDSALSYRRDYLYGGGFDVVCAVLRSVSPWGDYATAHRLGAGLGVLGLIGTWKLARDLAGPAAGFAALALLALTPAYYGHMFNNPKDLPFAVGYVWAMVGISTLAREHPRLRPQTWVGISLACGAACSVRVAGLLVLLYLWLTVVGLAWIRGRFGRDSRAAAATFRRLAPPAFAASVGAWAIMVLTWPWALMDPLRRPLAALGVMSHFNLHQRTMPLAGEMVLTTEPHREYLVHYFGLKLPEAVLGLLAVALVLAGWFLATRHVRPPPRVQLRYALLALAAVFPPVYAIGVGALLYDGLRHFLFVLPLFAAIAGTALTIAVRTLWRPFPLFAIALPLAAVALSGQQLAAMIRLHPHQYVFFNRIGGGLAGAHGRYDTDYYGNSYKELFANLAEVLWREDPKTYLNRVFVVSGCIPEFVARHYLPHNFRWRARGPDAGAPDFFAGYTRGDCHNRHPYAPVVARVERDGVVLAVVRDLRTHRR